MLLVEGYCPHRPVPGRLTSHASPFIRSSFQLLAAPVPVSGVSRASIRPGEYSSLDWESVDRPFPPWTPAVALIPCAPTRFSTFPVTAKSRYFGLNQSDFLVHIFVDCESSQQGNPLDSVETGAQAHMPGAIPVRGHCPQRTVFGGSGSTLLAQGIPVLKSCNVSRPPSLSCHQSGVQNPRWIRV